MALVPYWHCALHNDILSSFRKIWQEGVAFNSFIFQLPLGISLSVLVCLDSGIRLSSQLYSSIRLVIFFIHFFVVSSKTSWTKCLQLHLWLYGYFPVECFSDMYLPGGQNSILRHHIRGREVLEEELGLFHPTSFLQAILSTDTSDHVLLVRAAKYKLLVWNLWLNWFNWFI